MQKQGKSALGMERESLEGVFWVGIGIIICILARQFDLGSFSAPGPGFVAFLTGLFISVIGVTMIVACAVSKHRANGTYAANPPFEVASWRQLLSTVGLLLLFIILIEPVGFILATILLMFGFFFDWKKKNWFSSLFFAIVTAVVCFLIFDICLSCRLPRGLFPWW